MEELFDSLDQEQLLEKLNQRRNSILVMRTAIIILWVIFLLLMGVGAYLEANQVGELAVFALIGLILVTVIFSLLNSLYRKKYKEQVTNQLIRSIDSSLKFSKSPNHLYDLFQKSQLFENVQYVKSDDFVKGSRQGREVSFADVHAYYETGTDSTTTHTVFKGLLIHTSSSIIGETNIQFIPKKYKQRPAGLFESNKSELFNPLHDSEVGEHYIIKGHISEGIVAAKIENFLLSFTRQDQYPFLSFVNGQVIFALPYRGDLFDIKPTKKVTATDLELVYHELKHAAELAEYISKQFND